MVISWTVKMNIPLTIEKWSVARLRASPNNPRLHAQEQINKIQTSIEKFGWTNPILATPDGEIIAGEARWHAALAKGLEHVPVIVLGHLLPAEVNAYRVADNRLALEAAWDENKLASVLGDLQAQDFDVSLTGFFDREVRKILETVPMPIDLEETPKVPQVPVSRLSDLWICGPHRVYCGDSTLAESYATLMANSRASDAVLVDAIGNADLVFTDPPYGMSYKSKKHGMILNDDARGNSLINLVRDALTQARTASKAGASAYICLTWRTYADFLYAVEKAGLEVAACIVWDKGSVGLGNSHYRPQHEFIFYCKGQNWFGGKGEGDVWRLNRDSTAAYEHPTQKPVALIERALVNSTERGQVVLDPFGGSGSTLMAAEKQGRHARLIELDPKYVDVIVRRWQNATGKEARLVTGETFAEIEVLRQK